MKKEYLIVIILLLCSLIMGQQKPAYITAPLQCSTCHTCEVPTKNNPCLRPCIREHLVSVEHSADEAPEVITINKFMGQENLYQPAIFTHKLHAEMSHLAGGCQTCHHYNPPGRILTCIECHEIKRQRTDISKPDLKAAYHRQCIDCHRAWSHEVECKTCHAVIENTVPVKESSKKPVPKSVHPKISTPDKLVINTSYDVGKVVTFHHNDHVNVFGLDCQSCHSNESCIHCHDTKKTVEEYQASRVIHSNCSDCHDTDNKCQFCHAASEKPGFSHEKRTGWKLSDYHQKLTCFDCHPSKGKFTGLKPDCNSCHSSWSRENFDHKITGLVLDEIHLENECSDCHIGNSYSKPACDNCHDDIKYPENIPGKLIRN